MTEIANTITPYSWFYPLYVHASETNGNISPSKLEILFLLDTGASKSVLNLPTFHVISKQLNINVPTDLQNKRAKNLTVANQTEVPIIHYISMTCFTEVNHQTRSFNIDFTVALLNVKNHFTLNRGEEKPYISQLKTIQIYILNLKIIQNSIQQTHIHTSYRNSKISFIS